eukprot:scaffold8858_cov45-Isochrysis_galbana.AAC.1
MNSMRYLRSPAAPGCGRQIAALPLPKIGGAAPTSQTWSRGMRLNRSSHGRRKRAPGGGGKGDDLGKAGVSRLQQKTG